MKLPLSSKIGIRRIKKSNQNEAEILGRFIVSEKDSMLAHEIYLSELIIFGTIEKETCHRVTKQLHDIYALELVKTEYDKTQPRRYYRLTPIGIVLFFQYYFTHESNVNLEKVFARFFPEINRVWNKIKSSQLDKFSTLQSVFRDIEFTDIVDSMVLTRFTFEDITTGLDLSLRKPIDLKNLEIIIQFVQYHLFFKYQNYLHFMQNQFKFKNKNLNPTLTQPISKIEKIVKTIQADKEYSKLISEFERTIKQDVLDVIGQTKNPTKKRGRAP